MTTDEKNKLYLEICKLIAASNPPGIKSDIERARIRLEMSERLRTDALSVRGVVPADRSTAERAHRYCTGCFREPEECECEYSGNCNDCGEDPCVCDDELNCIHCGLNPCVCDEIY